LIPVQRHETTRPSLTEPKALSHPLGRCSLRLGPYQFFAVSALSA
jgi:hypothetical protein